VSDERAAPMYCPYCGDEDLRPHEDAHGAWECRSCTRVFSVKFVGLLARHAVVEAGGSGVGAVR
jgi:ribosomal protein L37AE/L43A